MKTHKLPSLSIFFPCYNDVNTIGGLVSDAYTVGETVAKKVEVIVVDDGSTDGSQRILRALKKDRFRKLRLIMHRHNRGYGGALKSGFAAAKNTWVFYTDGDGQYNVHDVPLLSALTVQRVDVVNGQKANRHDAFFRDVAATFYYWWIRWLFKTPIAEIDTDFRLIRRKSLQRIRLTKNSGAICVELIAKLAKVGARFIETPVSHHDRRFGNSQFFRPHRIISTLWDDLNLWWQLRHS